MRQFMFWNNDHNLCHPSCSILLHPVTIMYHKHIICMCTCVVHESLQVTWSVSANGFRSQILFPTHDTSECQVCSAARQWPQTYSHKDLLSKDKRNKESCQRYESQRALVSTSSSQTGNRWRDSGNLDRKSTEELFSRMHEPTCQVPPQSICKCTEENWCCFKR